MDEVLNGIKVLKLYAWEPSFEKMILRIRVCNQSVEFCSSIIVLPRTGKSGHWRAPPLWTPSQPSSGPAPRLWWAGIDRNSSNIVCTVPPHCNAVPIDVLTCDVKGCFGLLHGVCADRPEQRPGRPDRLRLPHILQYASHPSQFPSPVTCLPCTGQQAIQIIFYYCE